MTYTNGSKACDTPPPVQFRSFHTAFVWTAPNGTTHRFPIYTMRDNTICQEGVSGDSEFADDSSGYSMSVSNYTSATVYAPDGTQVYPTVMDSNGNFFSQDANGNIVDTLGRTPVKAETAPPPNTIIYDILNTQGGFTKVTVTTLTVSADTNFGQSGVAECTGCSFTAIKSITFDDGSSYSFTYDSGTTPGHFGELATMQMRTGGTVSYGYTTFADGAGNHSRWLNSKAVGSSTWTYTPVVQDSTDQQVTVKDCLGNSIAYSFSLNNGAWVSGANYFDASQAFLGGVTNTWDTSNTCGPNNGCSGAVMVRKLSSKLQLSTGVSKTVTYSYVSPETGQLSEIDESDYGTSSFPILRKTLFSYASLPNTVSKPSQITVKDGITTIAQTNYTYDEGTLGPTSGVMQHAAINGSRGNLTTVSRWLNTSGTYLNTRFTYDDTGNILSTADPGSNTTNFSYLDNFSDGMNRNSNAFVTQVTLPDTHSPGLAHHITHSQYDFNTGLPTNSIDQNGQQTTLAYDNLLRPLQINFPDGGQTSFSYPSPTQSVVQSKIDGTRSTYATTILDSLGRTSRAALANGEATAYDLQDFCYDGNGRLSFQSYPYQSGTYTGAVNCSESGDTFAYDGLGRPTKITHSDGSSSTVTYKGRARQITDEGNGSFAVSRILQSDALGRLAAVCEISGTTLLGSGGTPADCGLDLPGTGFLTSYSYDKLGNLTGVGQGTLVNRSFAYDSLSRMISESHPEWGAGSTATYGYDNDGLLISRIQPAPNQSDPNVNVTTSYSYDALYRLLTRTYSGDPSGTPTATFNYDEASPFNLVTSTNPIGRLTSEISGNAKSALGYDELGRVKNNWQCTAALCPGSTMKLLSYLYDYAGDMISAGNGAGVTLSYSYNAAPRLTGITSSYVDAQHPATLLSGIQYGPFGPLTDTLGNGLAESFGYSPRGALQSYSSAPDSFTLGLGPDLAITSANDSVNGNWTYAYDEFSRLASASKGTPPTQSFTYDYDRYGNRWHQNAPLGGPAPQYQMDNTNNRISGSGITYDALGNVTNDGLGNSFTYDAEDRLTKVVNANGATSYVYDSDGRRVSNGTYEFLYDLSGRVVTQFLTATGIASHEIVYAGGRHLATYSAGVTSFMHADWLGTKRVMTTLAGTPAVTCIGLPFGDGRNCTGNDRDFNEFTDDIDDSESSTEHTWFRQLSATQGRWFGPDPYLGSMNLADPQSLNRYAYVANNPTNAADPSGLKIIIHQDWFISAMQVFDPFCGEDDITSLDPCGFGQGNPFGNTVDSLVFGGFDGSGGLPLGGCFLPGSCPLQLGWPSLGDLLPHPPCNPLSPMLDGCGFGNFADGQKLTADQREECGRRAILSGAYAFLSDFIPTGGIIDPRSGAVAATVGALSEWREIITNPAIAGKVARVLTPIVGEIVGEAAVPVFGEAILLLQVGHALYEAGVAANEASESCEAKYVGN